MEDIIIIEDLYKKYKGRDEPVLNSLSMRIAEGEIFGLLGPNGAGKTTLISILYGLLKADSGHVRILGKEHPKSRKALSQHIGVVPQEYALYPTLTAAENLIYFGSLFGIPIKALKIRITEGLKQIGLLPFKDMRIETFSGGMKRRINLLAAILHKPPVLFLDEPTVGVDVQSKEAIIELLKQLNSEGTTIVYTSHHLNEAQNLCTKIAIMDAGRIIAQGRPSELITSIEGAHDLESVFIHLTGTELRDYA